MKHGDALTIFVASLGVAGVVYIATLDEVKGSMTVGDFSGFITAMVLLMTPLKRLTNVNAMIQRGIAAASSIFILKSLGYNQRDVTHIFLIQGCAANIMGVRHIKRPWDWCCRHG